MILAIFILSISSALQSCALFLIARQVREIEAEAAENALTNNHNAAIASSARTFARFASEPNRKALKQTINGGAQ